MSSRLALLIAVLSMPLGTNAAQAPAADTIRLGALQSRMAES